MIAPRNSDQEQAHLDALVAMAFKVDEALGEMCCDDARRDFVTTCLTTMTSSGAYGTSGKLCTLKWSRAATLPAMSTKQRS